MRSVSASLVAAPPVQLCGAPGNERQSSRAQRVCYHVPAVMSAQPPSTRHARSLPIRTPFFYGWLIVGVAFVASILSGATSQLFMSIMVRPMGDELGWSRTEISGALAVGVVATAVLAPFMGRLTDRHGPRGLMAAGAIVVSLGFGMLGGMGALWQLWAGYAITRGVSQSALSGVVPQTAITNWFFAKRGRAIGVFGMAFPIAPALLLPLAQWIIDTYSWRAVFFVFAAATALLVTVPALLVLRRRPEDVGLYPDGANAPPAERSASSTRMRGGEVNFTVKQAMRTPAFWLLVGSQFIGVFVSGSVSFHLGAYLGDRGVVVAAVATALSVYSITNGLSSGLWGYLSERISERVIAMVATSFGALVVVALMSIGGDALIGIAVCGLYGLVVRGENATLGLIIARYYGRASYGAISGTLVPIGYVGLGIGPLIGSMLYDSTHDYTTFLWLLMACHACNVVFLGLARRPQPPAAER